MVCMYAQEATVNKILQAKWPYNRCKLEDKMPSGKITLQFTWLLYIINVESIKLGLVCEMDQDKGSSGQSVFLCSHKKQAL